MQLTRRETIVAGTLAVTGCLGSGGPDSGLVSVAVHNPADERREASITVTGSEGDTIEGGIGPDSVGGPIEESVTVPNAGTVKLTHRVFRGQPVTASVVADGLKATTEWEVHGPLYAHLRSNGISFQRWSEIDTPRTRREDGRVDVTVITGHSESPIDARIRVGEFERDWTFPADASVTFHDRVPADQTVPVDVTKDGGSRLTESVSLDGVTPLTVFPDGEPSLRRVTPATE